MLLEMVNSNNVERKRICCGLGPEDHVSVRASLNGLAGIVRANSRSSPHCCLNGDRIQAMKRRRSGNVLFRSIKRRAHLAWFIVAVKKVE